MKKITSLQADGFHIVDFNAARPFSSFLPGIAGEYGKPLWVFYTNRGQCVSCFGVRDKNGAMLEFRPANQAYVLTSLLGFRTFLKISTADGPLLYEPFQPAAEKGVQQRLTVRAEEIEIEETNTRLGLRICVVYFTLPNENLPALVRRVTVENIGQANVQFDVLDGLPQIVPYGLEEKLLKQMSRTMEAFAEIRHVDDRLPFFKLKVEPSDKPEVEWIEAGFFAFTLHRDQAVEVITDPELIFGSDSTLRTPLDFMRNDHIDPLAARRETLTACAFAQLSLSIEVGATANWDSYYGQVPDWEIVRAFRSRITGDKRYASYKRVENSKLIAGLSARFAVLAGPPQLDPYSRQAFLDNTLRGGQPVVIEGPRGPRVFHTFTRKHGDMERDYNFFEVAPSYWSQGNGNFRDVNQNRRSENFIFQGVDASNIETFFNLVQLDGNNPLVIQPEKFCLMTDQLTVLLQAWPLANTPDWKAFLTHPFSPDQLLEALLKDYGSPDLARPWFDRVLGLADKIQDATHGEGYWVDHWIYNLDLLDSYAALYPDRLRSLLIERRDFSYFDNEHVVQPRSKKYVLRKDGTVRQLHAVVRDADKTDMFAQRSEQPHKMRARHGQGSIYRTSLLAKMLNLMALKASLLDPFGIGLEMEAQKPGWCDALNGLPGLFGSSTHEAYALKRWLAFTRRAVQEYLMPGGGLSVPVEVAALLRAITEILSNAELDHFFATWQQLAGRREAFREEVRLGVSGDETSLSNAEILGFLECVERVLAHGLAAAVDDTGLPLSYFSHEVEEFEVLPTQVVLHRREDEAASVHVQALRFRQKPVAVFLEGAVHALRSVNDTQRAQALHAAVRKSSLFDAKLGMYRVNAPLDKESFEIGRSRIFSPGWLENESIFLHMHYKFMLETLRSGLAQEFFHDLKQGLVAFHKPEVYGRSPLENSSFIASSRFPDEKVHGVGFVARLSGATAEWISMVLHMGLGAAPFCLVGGVLRFAPQPVLADWLFTTTPTAGFAADSFGFKLFGHTWVVYSNPGRQNTFGPGAVAPVRFELNYVDGNRQLHQGRWLPKDLALNLRDGKLSSLVIGLG